MYKKLRKRQRKTAIRHRKTLLLIVLSVHPKRQFAPEAAYLCVDSQKIQMTFVMAIVLNYFYIIIFSTNV